MSAKLRFFFEESRIVKLNKIKTPRHKCRGVEEILCLFYYSATTSNGISTETSLWSFKVAV